MIARAPVTRAVPGRPYPTCPLPASRPDGRVRCGAGMFTADAGRRDDPAVPPHPVLAAASVEGRRAATFDGAAHRLRHMRVRAFELRLIAVALVVCWSVAAGLVLLAYRPGGPLDLIVGLTAP